MADASSNYAIRNWTITSDEWWALHVPIDCDYLCVLNSEAALIRSDKDDPKTEKAIAAMAQEVILAPMGLAGQQPPRFRAGAVVFYMKAADAPSQLQCTFIY